MIQIDPSLGSADLLPSIDQLFQLSGEKILSIEKSWDPKRGTPVFTAAGRYTTRGWTEWTQGFQFGAAVLQFDATDDSQFLDIGRNKTLHVMAPHLTHIGVHDHGFNNISTYGNLLRLMHEGRLENNEWERHFYELALKCSGAVQASRWTQLNPELGYVRSFNGPHSLFADTIRSMRSLAVAHQLGHPLMGEKDEKISLLKRLLQHAETTARYNVYYGTGRDAYDLRGRTAHESIFNLADGSYRCPSSQQGYSPFSTWTRGLAWILLGYAEQLEFLQALAPDQLEAYGGREQVLGRFLEVATATAEFYIENTPTCGIPYWDTGAPGLARLEDYLDRPADPHNEFEPVDSSAAAIAAQGFIRLGNFLYGKPGSEEACPRYLKTGFTIARTLFSNTYLSENPQHQGLILHSVYHRPNGWDYIPPGEKVPSGESSMWGDYHARELALLIKRMATGQPYYTFFLS